MKRLAHSTAALLAGGCLLLACGGGDDEAAPSTTIPSTTSATTATTTATTAGYEAPAYLFDGSGAEDLPRCQAVDLANLSVEEHDLAEAATYLESESDLLGVPVINDLLEDPEARIPAVAAACEEAGLPMISVP